MYFEYAFPNLPIYYISEILFIFVLPYPQSTKVNLLYYIYKKTYN